MQPGPQLPCLNVRLLAALAGFKLVLQLAMISRYGIHVDELYFLSCAERLDLGYVDHPPLVPWIAALADAVGGGSLFALRILPCLATVTTVVLSGLLARELGGRSFAQGLAAFCVALAPVYLRTGNMLSLPSFEPLFWCGCGYALLRLMRAREPRYWMLFGLVAGVGLLNKHTTALVAAALLFGLALTHRRKLLLSRWLWVGGAIAVTVFSPNLWWQIKHDWATFEFVRSLNERVMSQIPRAEFLAGQLIYLGPAAAVVWLAGLFHCLRPGAGDRRVFGLAYLLLVVFFLITGAKVYYIAPFYPMLLAAGAVAWERWLADRKQGRAALVAWVTVGGAVFLPVSLPVLPIEMVDGYARVATAGLVANSHEVTGDLHSMFGWHEIADELSDLYAEVAPGDREGCVLFVQNYGQAGAFERFGRDLPPVISTHLSWSHWTRAAQVSAATVITYGYREGYLDEVYAERETLGIVAGSPFANPWERDKVVVLYRGPRQAFEQWWPQRITF